ncbi:hypothetical protein HK102_008308, partial [Quaeritorhiza haematococci]
PRSYIEALARWELDHREKAGDEKPSRWYYHRRGGSSTSASASASAGEGNCRLM